MPAANYDIVLQKGESFNRILTLNDDRFRLPIDLTGYTGDMQIRQHKGDSEVLVSGVVEVLCAETTSYVVVPAEDILTLNFEGTDGDITWVDEAQGLTPDDIQNCEIDTDQFYSGSSSLRLIPISDYVGSVFKYTISPIGAIRGVSFTTSFMFEEIEDEIYLIHAYESVGSNYIVVRLYRIGGEAYIEIRTDGAYFTDSITLLPNVWHTLDCLISRDLTYFKVDGVTIVSTAVDLTIKVVGIDTVICAADASTDLYNIWIDSFEIGINEYSIATTVKENPPRITVDISEAVIEDLDFETAVYDLKLTSADRTIRLLEGSVKVLEAI